MNAIALPTRSSWIAEGLRWIGSFFHGAELLPYEEFISDVRHRVLNRYY